MPLIHLDKMPQGFHWQNFFGQTLGGPGERMTSEDMVDKGDGWTNFFGGLIVSGLPRQEPTWLSRIEGVGCYMILSMLHWRSGDAQVPVFVKYAQEHLSKVSSKVEGTA